jgi:hypothetical protein
VSWSRTRKCCDGDGDGDGDGDDDGGGGGNGDVAAVDCVMEVEDHHYSIAHPH